MCESVIILYKEKYTRNLELFNFISFFRLFFNLKFFHIKKILIKKKHFLEVQQNIIDD